MTGTQPLPHFNLCAGHPALDFVNSLDNRFRASGGPTELLPDYAALLRFARAAGLIDQGAARRLADGVSPAAAARGLRAARELREALAAALYAHAAGRTPPAAMLAILERHFHASSRHRELRWVASGVSARRGAAPGWDRSRFGTRAELPVWLLSQAAAQLMLSAQLARVRACAADNCRWLFLDTSRNHTRRWCQMQVCGNRMKARRFQARR
jgi:predicted RNA-binding Zn ribbon-like protein